MQDNNRTLQLQVCSPWVNKIQTKVQVTQTTKISKWLWKKLDLRSWMSWGSGKRVSPNQAAQARYHRGHLMSKLTRRGHNNLNKAQLNFTKIKSVNLKEDSRAYSSILWEVVNSIASKRKAQMILVTRDFIMMWIHHSILQASHSFQRRWQVDLNTKVHLFWEHNNNLLKAVGLK